MGSVLYELVLGQFITAMALGTGAALNIARWSRGANAGDREAEYRDKLSEVAARYEEAFELFGLEVPPVVKGKFVDGQIVAYGVPELLRQLCNPDPSRREHHQRDRASDWGLEWVLKRVDIFVKRLHYAEREAKSLAVKRLRKSQ